MDVDKCAPILVGAFSFLDCGSLAATFLLWWRGLPRAPAPIRPCRTSASCPRLCFLISQRRLAPAWGHPAGVFVFLCDLCVLLSAISVLSLCLFLPLYLSTLNFFFQDSKL